MDEAEVYESKKPVIIKAAQIASMVIAGVVVLVGLVSAYMHRDQISLPGWLVSQEEQVVVEDDNKDKSPLKNEIFFTLVPSSEANSLMTHTYSTSNQMDKLMSRSFSGTQISFSPNGEWVTFLAPSLYLGDEEKQTMDDSVVTQVFRARVEGGKTLEDAMTNAEQVTDIQAAWKSVPSINDKGEILFVSRGIGTNSVDDVISVSPADWVVHKINTDGIMMTLVSGLYPQWLSKDDFLYLSEAGITYHSLVTNKDAVIQWFTSSNEDAYSEAVPATLYTIFNVSNDASMLVVSTSLNGQIDAYSINRQGSSDIALNDVASLSGKLAFWPQISPDNKKVGFLEYEPLRYTVYTLDTLEPVSETIDLSNFNSENIFITDWR